MHKRFTGAGVGIIRISIRLFIVSLSSSLLHAYTHAHTHTHSLEVRKGFLEFCIPHRLSGVGSHAVCRVHSCEHHQSCPEHLPGFSYEHIVGLQFLALLDKYGPVISSGKKRNRSDTLPSRASLKSLCMIRILFPLCWVDWQFFSWCSIRLGPRDGTRQKMDTDRTYTLFFHTTEI